MAKPLVTQQLVNETATVLIIEGTEPSIKNVQARIGGGSYTTVKKFLDQWHQERTAQARAATPTPPELESRGNELIRKLWILASTQAEAKVHAACEEAKATVTAIQQELNEARNEIARLETVEHDLNSRLSEATTQLRETELQLSAIRSEVARLAELEAAHTALQHELTAARQEAKNQAMTAAEKNGEITALKTQLQELLATLKPQGATTKKKREA